MFEIIESHDDKVTAQKSVNKLIGQEWRRRENRKIVWRPSSRQLDIVHNGELWFVSVSPSSDQKIERYWNSFGIYSPTGGLVITVEINVPTKSNSQNVSGFFARDPATGIVYLMHDGGVGGGWKGVSRSAFLAWSGIKLVPAVDCEGRGRLGIVVCPLVKGGPDAPVSNFVHRVAEFKRAVRDGRVPTGAAAKRVEATYDDYYREFSGWKRGKRAKEIEYISRHGEIVDELTRWRPASAKKGERVVKNCYVDLGIEVAGRLKVLYEVKTSASRQNLYAAIGQILVHGRECDGLERYIVIPVNEIVPADVSEALALLGIRVLHYKFAGKQVYIEQ